MQTITPDAPEDGGGNGIGRRAFRAALGRYSTGVTVVTTRTA